MLGATYSQGMSVQPGQQLETIDVEDMIAANKKDEMLKIIESLLPEDLGKMKKFRGRAVE